LVTAKILVLIWIVAKICNIGQIAGSNPLQFLFDNLEHSHMQILERSQSILEQVPEITIDFEKSLTALDFTKIIAIVQYLYNGCFTQYVGG
jgi:hypothetical protein